MPSLFFAAAEKDTQQKGCASTLRARFRKTVTFVLGQGEATPKWAFSRPSSKFWDDRHLTLSHSSPYAGGNLAVTTQPGNE